MQIDAHQHFWQLNRGDYGWLTPKLAPIYQDFLPTDLAPHLTNAGVDATIVVQAAPTEAETHYLLTQAKSAPFVAGVVGWVDMAAPDAPDRLAALKESGDGYLKGIRPMIQDIADPDWILSPSLDAAFDAIEGLDLCFDALVLPAQLDPLLRRLEQCPGLQVVINHAAKPNIPSGMQPAWSDRLAAIAEQTSAMCKFSGLVTEAGEDWRAADIAPFFEHILASFGADRIMWGSDWPVVNLVSDYPGWRTASEELVAGLPAPDRTMIFGGTAARFYGIETPESGT